MDKILCVYKGDLVLGDVIGGDGGADYDVDYVNADIIAKDVVERNSNDLSNYGILMDGDNFSLLEYSWDGFQPSELEGLDALAKIMEFSEFMTTRID